MPLAMNFRVDLIARDHVRRCAVQSLGAVSQAIVWGLSFASLLTLIDPAMLTLLDSMKRRLLGQEGCYCRRPLI